MNSIKYLPHEVNTTDRAFYRLVALLHNDGRHYLARDLQHGARDEAAKRGTTGARLLVVQGFIVGFDGAETLLAANLAECRNIAPGYLAATLAGIEARQKLAKDSDAEDLWREELTELRHDTYKVRKAATERLYNGEPV